MDDTALHPRTELCDAREMLRWWLDDPATGVVSRSLVVDRLLDLRSLVSSSSMLMTETAHLLSNVPGVNVVEAEWWNATAQRLFDLVTRIDELSDLSESRPG